MKIFAFIILLTPLICLSQKRSSIYFTGRVISHIDSLPIPGITIYLKTKKKNYTLETDSLGKYFLEIKHPKFKQIYLSINKDVLTKKTLENSKTTSEEKTFTLNRKLKINTFEYDFIPIGKYEAPKMFFFKKNTIQFDTLPTTPFYFKNKINKPSEVLQKYCDLLSEYPTIVLAIHGYCSSDEIEPKQLSYLRAEFIKHELIKLGINGERLVLSEHGDKHPFMLSSFLSLNDGLKWEEERFYPQRRHVVCTILNWEFDDGTTKKTKKPTYKPPIQKEGEMENILPLKPDKKEN